MQAGRSQVGAHLGVVDIFQGLDGLQLDDDFSLHDQIEAMRTDLAAFVEHANLRLMLKRQAAFAQGHSQGVLVDRLHKSRPQLRVDVDGSLEYLP